MNESISIKALYRKLVPLLLRQKIYKVNRMISIYYNIINITMNDSSIRQKNKRLLQFHNLFSGNRCFIMGNGPSLNLMDLSLLDNEYVWGSNRCYLLFDRIMWRPSFYVAVDTRVVPDNANEINALVKSLNETLFFFPEMFRYNKIINSKENVYWYHEIQLQEDNLPYGMFSIDPSKFVYSVRSVTIAMLQLAVYLGFNPIYLIGCDTSYIIPKTVIFENGNQKLLISTQEDPNHFDSAYFGEGKKWHDPNVEAMIFHYTQAKKVCDELNIKIYNATVGGNLEVFPRVNYLDLF